MRLSQGLCHKAVIVLAVKVHKAVDQLNAVATRTKLQFGARLLETVETGHRPWRDPVPQKSVPVPLIMVEQQLPEEPLGVVLPTLIEIPDEQG